MSDPLYIAYHDEEWGRPVRDDARLLERLCLEGFQSGLSWLTILRKRERFRELFEGFDPRRLARLGDEDVERLMADAGIVRNRAKIEAAIANANATLTLQRADETLTDLLWSFAPGGPTRRSPTCCGPSLRAGRSARRRRWPTRRPRPPSPRRWRASSSAAAFGSSARRRPTR